MTSLVSTKPVPANGKEPIIYTMNALVYHGPGKKAWQQTKKAVIQETTDAVVKILKTTICGTDLHIMKGDLPEVKEGRILGHEGVPFLPAPMKRPLSCLAIFCLPALNAAS